MTNARQPDDPVASPCIGVCHIDQATGWCAGCGRSIQEIADWGAMPETEKVKVIAALAERRARSAQNVSGAYRASPD